MLGFVGVGLVERCFCVGEVLWSFVISWDGLVRDLEDVVGYRGVVGECIF